MKIDDVMRLLDENRLSTEDAIRRWEVAEEMANLERSKDPDSSDGLSTRSKRQIPHSRIVDSDHHLIPVRRGRDGKEIEWIKQGDENLTTREWLESRGMNIDDYTVRLTPGDHDAIHRRLTKKEKSKLEDELSKVTDSRRRKQLE